MKKILVLVVAVLALAALALPAFATTATAWLTKAERAISIADLQAELARADLSLADEQTQLDTLVNIQTQGGAQKWLTRAIADARWWLAYYAAEDARIRYVLAARGA